jgi:hypothetical protein
MTFALDLVHAAGFETPPEWKWMPWPGAIADEIQALAKLEKHCGQMTPGVINFTADDTKTMFLRAKNDLLVPAPRTVIIPPATPPFVRPPAPAGLITKEAA